MMCYELIKDSQEKCVSDKKSDKESTLHTFLLHEQQSSFYTISKRIVDIVVACLGLAMLGLLLPLITLLIVCEDGGPVFYRQVRVGYQCQPFTIYKIRSMVLDADHYLTQSPQLRAEWERIGKLKHDPRITRLGAVLRRTSLDELPQMLNILRGEMSLVGPRAIQFSELLAFGDLIELRQTIKPGLTGLWQICGRSATDYEQRRVLDCTYVLQRSLSLDLYILAHTFPVVLHGVGAY